MKRLLLAGLIVPLAACASARAQIAPEDHPALVVPPTPPRVIEPLPAEPPPIEPVAELPNSTPSAPPRPRPQREPNKTAADPKAEVKPPDTPVEAPPQPTAAQPVPPLRTPGDPDGPEMARQITSTLERTNRLLGTVNYQSLNGERRANYDNAKSFIKQSEDALKASNYTLAKSLADRAESIAKLLAGG